MPIYKKFHWFEKYDSVNLKKNQIYKKDNFITFMSMLNVYHLLFFGEWASLLLFAWFLYSVDGLLGEGVLEYLLFPCLSSISVIKHDFP